ncbi:MAG: hypothetical protein COU06_02775 [Candidatus Harrisonbacteria bacterium CG10_big_fil_rev_8_21_14_0_10_38_8]|uniref:50S ribosomal protein L35 n=1 Tax=Candidatus Harrisonbacteria bacterium CG10_big_fil_rev_8_21_14_0_10_38_8 TaxID=1974582 RepID=A0A2M6WJJ8_9BACT|nr:MAG: hypothetical protein COU06_02775 [Candidatus Harrisonbacteria bacterium CG10_big_fil_rev_8_21_14_0_10_38_8]
MKKSVSSRIRITKTGKIIRGKMGTRHCGSRKTSTTKRRKKITHRIAGVDTSAIRGEMAKKNFKK